MAEDAQSDQIVGPRFRPEKKGARLFRSLTGKAALLAEPIEDDELFKVTAVDYILEYFDKAYEGFFGAQS